MAFLFKNGLGGVLADGMGARQDTANPGPDHPRQTVPGVAPNSVVSNGEANARRFAPTLNTTAVTDTPCRSSSDAGSGH